MKQGYIYLILVVMIITHGTAYFMGANNERTQNEKEIDLTYEAAAQSYKNHKNDSSKFDLYGNNRSETDTLRRVLPETSRTKIADPKAKRDKNKTSNTRRRNY